MGDVVELLVTASDRVEIISGGDLIVESITGADTVIEIVGPGPAGPIGPQGPAGEGGTAGRTKLDANTTFYVATTGDDTTGDGTNGAPWATLQHAYDVLAASYDFGGFTATMQVADGTYAAGLSVGYVGAPLIGGSLYVRGNLTNPENVIINGNFEFASESGHNNIGVSGFTVQYLEALYSNMLTVGASPDGSETGAMRYTGVNRVIYIGFGAQAEFYGTQIFTSNSIIAGITVDAGFVSYTYMQGWVFENSPVTVSEAFLVAIENSHIAYFAQNTTPITGTVTGTRVAATRGSVVSVGQSNIPGSVDGVPDATSIIVGSPSPLVPVGGTTGQVLAKSSGNDFETAWVNPDTGPQGAQGPAGPQGVAGSNGSNGAQGPQGPAGSAGSQGPQGNAGSAGSQGSQGPQGFQGPAGSTPAIGGSNTQVQYNNSGAFGGDAGMTYDATNKAVTVGGATVTTSNPVLNMSQTWNAGAVAFTGMKLNVTDTASAAASLLADLQVGGTSKFSVKKDGMVNAASSNGVGGYGLAGELLLARLAGYTGLMAPNGGNGIVFNIFGATTGGSSWAFVNSTNFALGPNHKFGWSGSVDAVGTQDLFLTRKGAANLQLGSSDAAAPVAQTLSVQSVVAGTTNTAGANWTLNGSRGTGTGVGGDVIIQVAPAGTTGTSQNALAEAIRAYSNQTVKIGKAYTVSTLPTAGTQGRRAWVTDATAPTFLGTLTGGGSVVCPVFDNGTAWVAG